MNYAVLLSGGTGTRISSDIPKQYVRVGEYMIVTSALKTLTESGNIDSVCIVADPAWREEIEHDISSAGIDESRIIGFADPGKTRQCSIYNALEFILVNKGDSIPDKADDDTVLIHDAARPMLKQETIAQCYDALPGHDGVMPVLPMKDTVYQSDDGKAVSKLLDRSRIFAGQAPELFRLHAYYEANKKLLPDDILKINGASEPAVMAGMDIVMIPGDEGNFKITTDADMDRFRELAGK